MIWNLAVVISSSNINSSAFGELYSVPKVTKSLRHSNTIGHKIILTSHNGVRYKGFAGSPMSTLMRGRDELSAWSPMPTPVSGSRLKTHFSYFKFSISTILLNNSCWRWIIPFFCCDSLPGAHERSSCSSFPCQNGGTCISGPAGFICACRHPFTGDTCTVKTAEENALAPGTSLSLVCFAVSHTNPGRK